MHRLSRLHACPDFIKAANLSELRPDQPLSPGYYGDPRCLAYPLHTKAATWANYGFFLENIEKGIHTTVDAAMIDDRFKKAATEHGISRALESLKESHLSKRARPAAQAEAELSDDDFVAVWTDENGHKHRRLPVRNGLEIKAAAEYLLKNRDQLEFDTRRQMAEFIRDKVTNTGSKLPDDLSYFLDKQAGAGTCPTEVAAKFIESRVAMSRRGPGAMTPLQETMLKTAECLRQQPTAWRNPDIRLKTAKAIDSFDRSTGVAGAVSRDEAPRIEDVLFNYTREKLASIGEEHVSTTTGSIYRLDSLSQLKIAAIRNSLGDEVAETLTSDGHSVDIEKAARVIPTLDRGLSTVLDRLMESQGLLPTAKEAIGRETLTTQYLFDLRKQLRLS